MLSKHFQKIRGPRPEKWLNSLDCRSTTGSTEHCQGRSQSIDFGVASKHPWGWFSKQKQKQTKKNRAFLYLISSSSLLLIQSPIPRVAITLIRETQSMMLWFGSMYRLIPGFICDLLPEAESLIRRYLRVTVHFIDRKATTQSKEGVLLWIIL